jgi:hypothetical protein
MIRSPIVIDPAAVIAIYSRPGFMNPGVNGAIALELSVARPDPMELAVPAAERVVKAYRHALTEQQLPAPSLWDHAAKQQSAFLNALASGNVEAVAADLSEFFATPLVWGVAPVLTPDASEHAYSGYLVRTADTLVSLAQAVGVYAVQSIEQRGPLHHQVIALETIDGLVASIERHTGLTLSFLDVASNRGWRFGSRVTNADTLRHTYGVWRLRQLGVSDSDAIAEIGGGFGCMAALAARAGFRNYTILDLPWVNAIQGYILIRTLGHDAVQLHGETTAAAIKIAPFWTISALKPRSVDVFVNVNSLPEIGYDTARHYLERIAATVRRLFLSINQEGEAPTVHGTRQLRVWELARNQPTLQLRARHLSWMEQGYVEEIYCPAEGDAMLASKRRPFPFSLF